MPLKDPDLNVKKDKSFAHVHDSLSLLLDALNETSFADPSSPFARQSNLSRRDVLEELLRISLSEGRVWNGEFIDDACKETFAHAARMKKSVTRSITREEISDRSVALLLAIAKKDILPVQLLSIKVIWSLTKDLRACNIVCANGGLKYLLQLLKEGESPTNEHRQTALDVLQNVACKNPARIIVGGGVELMMRIIRFGNRSLQVKSIMCLRNMTLKEPHAVIPYGVIVSTRPLVDEFSAELGMRKADSNMIAGMLQNVGLFFECPHDAYHDELRDTTQLVKSKAFLSPFLLLTDMKGKKVTDVFQPSLLFVSHRFGFESASDGEFKKLVDSAERLGWKVTVSAQEISSLTFAYRVTSDPSIFTRQYDLCVVKLGDTQEQDASQLRVCLCPTNSTAGVMGLRRSEAQFDEQSSPAHHFAVNCHEECGLSDMSKSIPRSSRRLDDTVDVVSMPTNEMLFHQMRIEMGGTLEVMIAIHTLEMATPLPFASSSLSLVAIYDGEEIFSTAIKTFSSEVAQHLPPFPIVSGGEARKDSLHLYLIESSALVARERIARKCFAHATYVVSPVSVMLGEASVRIRFKKRDDVSPFSNAGILWLKINSKWSW